MSKERPGFRLAIAGASGTLGRELLDVLGTDRFPIAELLPFATASTTGVDVSYMGDDVLVAPEMPRLSGLDALVLCTPSAASLDLAREALRAEVMCLDASGAFLSTPEVGLGVAGLISDEALRKAPLVCAPPGGPLALGRVAQAIAGNGRVVGVTAMLLSSSGDLGRRGMDALSEQTVALLNQSGLDDEAGPPDLDGLAFDCRPVGGGETPDAIEQMFAEVMGRLFGAGGHFDAFRVRVPTFVGEGAVLQVELEGEPTAEDIAGRLGASAGIDAWLDVDPPSTRDTAGRDEILVAAPVVWPATAPGHSVVRVWVASDPVRVAARNLADLLRQRLLGDEAPSAHRS